MSVVLLSEVLYKKLSIMAQNGAFLSLPKLTLIFRTFLSGQPCIPRGLPLNTSLTLVRHENKHASYFKCFTRYLALYLRKDM